MLRKILFFTLAAAAFALAGCGSEQADGWSSENKHLYDSLEKVHGDVTKLSPEDKAAYDKISPPGTPKTLTGSAGPAPSGTAPAATAPPSGSGMPAGYATPNGR